MNKHFTLFSADADNWIAAGMKPEEEDDLVLALWHWYRGREVKRDLSVAVKVLYSTIVERWKYSDKVHKLRSLAGVKGNAVRWSCDRKGIARPGSPPASATASAPASASSLDGGVPAESDPEFVKPSVGQIRDYCALHGYSLVDPDRFVNYYESVGWRIGNCMMKSWQAAVRNWHLREKERSADSAVSATALKQDGYVLRFGMNDGQEGAK